jgi:hypothetical protein
MHVETFLKATLIGGRSFTEKNLYFHFLGKKLGKVFLWLSSAEIEYIEASPGTHPFMYFSDFVCIYIFQLVCYWSQ